MAQHASFMAVMTAFCLVALVGPAAAQGRPSAMTCDYYQKQISAEVTRSRRAEQAARIEAERARITQGMDEVADPRYPDLNATPEEANQGPPPRDYGAIDQLRREANMLCAQRKYEEGVNTYKKALGLLGIRVE